MTHPCLGASVSDRSGDLQTVARTTNVPWPILGTAKDSIMQAFIVSIVAGCLLPMLPIMAEYGLTDTVPGEMWSVTGAVYTAAVGIASRNQIVVTSSFFCSTICAVIYGVEKYVETNHTDMPYVEYGPIITQTVLYCFVWGYAIERFGRHCVEKRPYLEL